MVTFDINSIDHEFYMREALVEAELAMKAGERPIGAVIVHNGQIVGRVGQSTKDDTAALLTLK